MAFYDSVDCLARFRRIIRRPTGSDFPTDAQAYQFLGEAQIAIFTRLAVYAPKACIIPLTQMTLASDSKSATFGTDSALPTAYTDLYPIGNLRIYRQKADAPDTPMVEGVEYRMAGNRIDFPSDSPFSGPAPYYESLLLPDTLDGSSAPSLKPVQARQLIVDVAAVRFSEDISADASDLKARYEEHWNEWIGVLQTQYAQVGSIAATHPNAGPGRGRWYGTMAPRYR